MGLFTRQPLALHTAFSELKRQASEQSALLIGTPGSIGEREVGAGRFLYRQFYDAEGRKAAEYVGAVSSPGVEERVRALRAQIESTQALAKDARLLARSGYARADGPTMAIVASLANHGLFRGGAVLVGSHAYGALLNELGIAAASYLTEDVDVARGSPLELARAGRPRASFEEMLTASTVALHPVPGLGRKTPATSYKARGRSRLRVDLLVPARGTQVTTRAVPELDAHATAVPYLAYLLTDPIEGAVLGREGAVPVKIPRPEAFAWHKMLVSRLRRSTREKAGKDLAQASVLVAVLAEDAPDALAAAFRSVPRSAVSHVRAAAARVIVALERAGHERAVEMMRGVV